MDWGAANPNPSFPQWIDALGHISSCLCAIIGLVTRITLSDPCVALVYTRVAI